MIKKIKALYKKDFFSIPLLSILLTLLLTWPLLLYITSYFPVGGDGVVEAWIAWYVQHALITGRIFNQTLFFNGPQFYPLPYTIAYSDNLFLLSSVLAPIYWLTQNINFWINSITLLTFVFTYCASYYVIKKITKNMWASIIGAFIFTFNPITFAHYVPGHINLLSKYFLLLEFYFGFTFLSKPSWKNSFLFFLFFTLDGLSSIYFEIFSIVCIPLFCLPFLGYQLYKKNVAYFKHLFAYSLSSIIFIPFLFYFNYPYLQFSIKENVVRTISESIYYSAQPIDFLASLPINLVYGPFVRYLDSSNPPKITGGVHFYYGHTLALDIIPSVLALFGLFYLFHKRKKTPNKILFIALSFVFFFSLLMMFGPYLQIVPGLVIKFPYYYLYTYSPLPILQSIRAPARFEFVLYIPFSILSSFGVVLLLEKFRKHSLIITAIILILLISENINSFHYTSKNTELSLVSYYKNNKIVDALLENKILLNYPNLDPNQYNEEANYLLWSIFFDAKILNGDTGYLPSDLFTFLNTIDVSKNDSLAKLKALGVQDIIIHNSLARSLGFPITINKKLLVYQDNAITILNMNKLPAVISYCDKKDMHYSFLMSKYIVKSQPLRYHLVVKNTYNCYLISTYQDRYVLAQMTLNGEKYSTYLQFPPVIGPFETDILTGTLTNISVTSLGTKSLEGNIAIGDLGKSFTFTVVTR